MTPADLAGQPDYVRQQAARMLVEQFDGPRGWPTMTLAAEAVAEVFQRGFALAVLDGELLLGWIGGLPEYEGRVWELHPLVVDRRHRKQGIGRALVAAFEREASRRGGLTATLGTDDNTGMTSLAGVDLYTGVCAHISGLRDLGGEHPFLFYGKLGYVVTGVMPDANGRGRPDIFMSKRIGV